MDDILIRPEAPGDAEAIGALTTEAFADAAHRSGTEADIVAALRADGQLSLSLVAEAGGVVVGHLAVSPVTIPGAEGWFGLGPVSVVPGHQGRGIGGALIRAALAQLETDGAAGCVVLGDPGYYPRFGFEQRPGLGFDGVPAEYFMARVFRGPVPQSNVAYHPAFHP